MQELSDERLSPPREHEAFGAMFEQAGFGVAQVSLDGEWLAANQALCDILGYAREDLLGTPLRIIVRFDQLGAELGECERLLRGEILSFSSQKRHLRRDGRVIWLKATVTLVRDDVTQAPESFLAILEDRTLRHKAIQQAISEGDNNFRVLTDNISDLFFSLDLDLRCSFWNRAAESLTGILAGAVLGRRVGEAFGHGQGVSDLEQHFRAVLATRQARSFSFPCSIGGKDFLFEVTAYPSKDGLSVVARDVAARQRAEEALRKSEEKFAKAFQASPAIITIVRIHDCQFIEANLAFERQTGFSRSDVVGRTISEVGRQADLESFQYAFAEAVSHGTVRNREALLRRKTGEVLTVLLSADVVEFDGQPCVLTVAEDITERKQAELDRTELSRRLMTAQEAERRRIARELHDGIGQSLALLGIQLQRADQPTASGKTKPRLSDLCTKVKEIGTQVSRLSHQLHSSELEFLGLVVAIKSLCREFSEEYGFKVDCVCRNVPEELENDVALCLLRLVQEALHNIAKHSHATLVQMELSGTPRDLVLTLADNGEGFDLAGVRSTAGLGLVSMRERMHLLGGSFEITSKPGSGTKIQARVPLLKQRGSLAFTTVSST